MRSLAYTLISVALAVAAHMSAGGTMPGWPSISTAGAILLAVGWQLSKRERSGVQLGILVIATQLLLHAAFVAVRAIEAMHAGVKGPSSATLAALLLCHHGGRPIPAAQVHTAAAGIDLGSLYHRVGGGSSAAAAAGLTPAGVGMFVAHLLAAGVVAWWLRRGERAAWAAARRVISRLLPPAPPQRLPAPRLVPAAPRWTVVSARWGGRLPGRGPPPPHVCCVVT